MDDFCDSINGQCKCYENIEGQKCNKCKTGFYGFPQCKKCSCNGFSSKCTTNGTCLDCLDNTEGVNCQRFKIIIIIQKLNEMKKF
jgi:hypothetical protein